jgi:hypothetical protein
LQGEQDSVAVQIATAVFHGGAAWKQESAALTFALTIAILHDDVRFKSCRQ